MEVFKGELEGKTKCRVFGGGFIQKSVNYVGAVKKLSTKGGGRGERTGRVLPLF